MRQHSGVDVYMPTYMQALDLNYLNTVTHTSHWGRMHMGNMLKITVTFGENINESSFEKKQAIGIDTSF